MLEITDTDEEGNILVIKNDVVKQKLFDKQEWKKIADISRKLDGTVELVKYVKIIYRKTTSFGVCSRALELVKPDSIKIIYNGNEVKQGTYTISMSTFEDEMEYKNFKSSGFELQSFVPVEKFDFT